MGRGERARDTSGAGWDDGVVSNRRRTAADRTGARTPAAEPARRSRPFGGTRSRVNLRSYTVLQRLHALPRWTVPLSTVVLVFVGLYAGPVLGAISLFVIAGFLGWLAYLAWPQMSRSARLVRSLVLGALTGIAIARLLGFWG